MRFEPCHTGGDSPDWHNGFCGCCSLKGCGIVPCCCPNMCCCMPCMWASAMSQIKGKEAWGSYWKCCIAAQCCPCCTFCLAYKELTAHYGITDELWFLKAFCAHVLSYMQILDTVLVKENLQIVMVNVAPDSPGGAPAGAITDFFSHKVVPLEMEDRE